MKYKIGILGYGNLAKGVEKAILKASDMELVAVFSRRADGNLATNQSLVMLALDKLKDYQDKIDVLILCGGSATDLPKQSVEMVKNFNIVDSFDTHATIPEHFKKVDEIASKNNHIAVISAGWDPGLFSIARAMFGAMIPSSSTYTFWGKGVSQGHSDAIRRVEGVVKGVQYTIPIKDALDLVRSKANPELTTRQKHNRVCYVVVEKGYDREVIREKIVNMKNYFSDYDTTVNFITDEEFEKNHKGMPHGGFVLTSGNTSDDNKHLMELSIHLDSNPEFTGSILLAYARAAARMNAQGIVGAKTVLDIPLSMISPLSAEELRKTLV